MSWKEKKEKIAGLFAFEPKRTPWRLTWTLLVELFIIFVVGMTVILFETVGLLPALAVTLADIMGVGEMLSLITVVAMWLVPFCFVALLLLVATVRFLSWLWHRLSSWRAKMTLDVSVYGKEDE